MIAVDTNILVRYLVRDDAAQYDKASEFLNKRTPNDQAYVSLIVIAELVWVLRRLYRYSREQVHFALCRLLETAELAIEDEQYVGTLVASQAVIRGEVADHLIVHAATKAGCSLTVTFDQDAARRVPSMELLA